MPSPHPAGFDSSSAAAAAVAAALRGREVPALGKSWAGAARPLLVAANHLPMSARRWLYAAFTGAEGQRAKTVRRARWDALSAPVVAAYPRRRYPAAVVGSAPGPMVDLCAALGAPLLPQTQLLPLRRRGVDPDDPRAEIAAVEPVARALADHAPELVVHHMIDPNEDRLTLRYFSYLRVKTTRLGDSYEQFLRETLRPGGTIFVSDCRATWPSVDIGGRYLFQFGGVGGATHEEYFSGGPRVADLLARYGSTRRGWDPPAPDVDAPEAEWGFEPELYDDVAAFAGRHGFRVVRLSYADAMSPSPLLSELYRWWFSTIGDAPRRLFAGSFVLMAPHLMLTTRTVPHWATFCDVESVGQVSAYLASHEPYDEILLTLMAHGTESIGVSTEADWKNVLGQARDSGVLAGVDRRAFPADFGVYVRYRDDLRRLPRHPLPARLPVATAEEFLRNNGLRYGVSVD